MGTVRVTIDFECRSRVDIGDCGPDVYAENPSTDVICLAVKEHSKPPRMWVPNR